MHRTLMAATALAAALSLAALIASASVGGATTTASVSAPVVGKAVAFDTTPPLTELRPVKPKGGEPKNIGESGDEFAEQRAHQKDGALQETVPAAAPGRQRCAAPERGELRARRESHPAGGDGEIACLRDEDT